MRRSWLGRLCNTPTVQGLSGTRIHTQLLAENLVDEVQLVDAPLFVGGGGAHRFVSDGLFPFDAAHRMALAGVRQIGDVALLRYAPNAQAPLRINAS